VAESDWNTLWGLFDRVVERPVAERAAWLDARCDDDGMRRELDALLRAHDRQDSLLDCDPIAVEDAALEPGERIGAWQVLSILGVGGMGEVYLVERADGAFERRAALKLLHGAGLGGPGARERFERERRILGSLNHPNIARLLDAGMTESGRPWLLMEAVDGPTVAEWRTQCAPTLGETLEVFLQICSAIAHAHRRLVVHRDLKPSNVRMARDGRPRMLDFGIAKLLDAAADGKVTRRGDTVPLTPGYASPEQIRGEQAGTAMDVYALGVLLHELLGGAPPFDGRGCRADWLEQRRCLTVAVSRKAGTPVELDWVLARALAFDPEDRYPGAEALAADIRRVRAHRTPLARSVGPLYRARKFARRHWRALGLGIATLLLVAGLGAELYRSAERARAARVESEAARGEAERLSSFLKELFVQSDPTRASGRELTALEILDAGRQRLAQQPDLAASSRIAFWLALGDVYLNLGQHATARELASQAAQLARRTDADRLAEALALVGEAHYAAGAYEAAIDVYEPAIESLSDPADPAAFTLAINRGMARQRLGDYRAAGEAFRKAAEWQSEHAPDAAAKRAEVALRLGSWHWSRGRLETAERFYGEALQARRDQVPAAWPEVATAMMARASARFAQGRFDEARAGYADALAIRRRVLGAEHPDTAVSLNYLGAALYELGRHAEAEGPLSEAVDIQRRALPADSPARTGALNNLGLVQWQLGRLEEAASTFRRALVINRKNLGADHPNVANNTNNLGLIAIERRRFDEALEHFDRAVEVVAAARGDDHPDLGPPLTNRARALMVLERSADADAALARAHAVLGGAGGAHPRLIDTLIWWSLSACLRGEAESAPERLDRASDIVESEPAGAEDRARIAAVRAACKGRRAVVPEDSPPDFPRLLERARQAAVTSSG
jgi:serine/threonine-protein kinase